MNSDSFINNTGCRYFPCHETAHPEDFNCLFCYCPLYMLGDRCGGNFTYTEKGIKNCTDCTVPHRRDAAAYIRSRFPEIAQRAAKSTAPQPAPAFVQRDGDRFRAYRDRIAPADEGAAERCKARWDGIAKPLNGLGQLETAVMRIAALTGSEQVSIDKRAVAVFCADNGVVKEGVTQTDASVTAVMARRIAEHRSSVCLMAKSAHADVFAVDLGMLSRVEGVRDLSVGSGTANMTKGPAMTEAQALRAIENGIALAEELKHSGYRILVTGEMGIGNTTSSAAVASVLLGLSVDAVTGRGAGLSDEGLVRKRSAIRRAIEINRPDPNDAFDVLRKVGGFDLAGLAGLYIGAATERIPILIDGLPSSVAALVAARLVPEAKTAMLATHCSAEPVAKAVLESLGLTPVLFAGMKLGEGTGAVCMLPLLDAALAVYNGSVTFSDTGIAQYVPQRGDER